MRKEEKEEEVRERRKKMSKREEKKKKKKKKKKEVGFFFKLCNVLLENAVWWEGGAGSVWVTMKKKTRARELVMGSIGGSPKFPCQFLEGHLALFALDDFLG